MMKHEELAIALLDLRPWGISSIGTETYAKPRKLVVTTFQRYYF